MDTLRESDLYGPVRDYLVSLGYDVKAEVKDCDIAAVKDGELIVVELKTGFTIELLYQASRRQMIADGVYVAVPLPKGGYRAPRYDDMVRLCRKMEIGLIFVGFTAGGSPQIDPAVHPAPARAPRRNARKRLAVLTEHSQRTGSRNTGGVTRRKILTVYKEKSLAVVAILLRAGELTPAQVRAHGGPDNAGAILQKNYYSYFQRGEAHRYSATEAGAAALAEHADLFPEQPASRPDPAHH